MDRRGFVVVWVAVIVAVIALGLAAWSGAQVHSLEQRQSALEGQRRASATTVTPNVSGKATTMADLVTAYQATANQVQSLTQQVANEEPELATLRTAVLAVGQRAGCGYNDLGVGAPFCPRP